MEQGGGDKAGHLLQRCAASTEFGLPTHPYSWHGGGGKPVQGVGRALTGSPTEYERKGYLHGISCNQLHVQTVDLQVLPVPCSISAQQWFPDPGNGSLTC